MLTIYLINNYNLFLKISQYQTLILVIPSKNTASFLDSPPGKPPPYKKADLILVSGPLKFLNRNYAQPWLTALLSRTTIRPETLNVSGSACSWRSLAAIRLTAVSAICSTFTR